MLKASHRTLIFISGLIWLIVGVFLLTFGIYLVIETLRNPLIETRFSLVKLFGVYFGSIDNGVVSLLALSLFVGYMKGRHVLAKSARKQITRILSLSPPVPINRLYNLGYYILIGTMIGIGVAFRFSPFASDVRGSVDIAVGAALLSGALTYFRFLVYGERKINPKLR